MDRDRFDALARLLATKGSRRGALGSLLGVALFGQDPGDGLAKLGKDKNKKKQSRGKGQGKGSGRDRDTGRGKDRGRNQQKGRDRQRAEAEAVPASCCSGLDCTPGIGKNLAKCCYQGQNLAGRSFKAANLGEANFSGAILTNTNFTAANLDKTCFAGADLTGAKFAGTNTGAIFCNTTMPDGSTSDRDCAKGTTCCETCVPACTGALRCCPDGTCQECCANGQCPAGQGCVQGRCVCNAASCPNGCCTNGPGNPGECRPRSDDTCGRNGAQCVDCPVDTVCNAQGQCVCNANSCSNGCCDTPTGPCIRTPSNQNCGADGAICRDCATTPAAPVCVNGQCVCPSPRVVCDNICCTQGQVCDTQGRCCTPQTVDQTCGVGPARRCGQVANNCGQEVDCGACAPVTCRVVACQQNACVVTGNQANRTSCTTAAGGPGICCDGTCVAGNCCGNADCTGGSNTCTNNQCRCGMGPACTEPNETCCGASPQGACIDTTTNPSNCGTCGTVCPPTLPVCRNGTCSLCQSNAECGSGQVCCGGLCHVGECCALRGPCGPDAPCCSGPNAPDRACCVDGRCCLVSPTALPPTVCGDGDCCTDICLAGVPGSRLCGPRNLPTCPG